MINITINFIQIFAIVSLLLVSWIIIKFSIRGFKEYISQAKADQRKLTDFYNLVQKKYKELIPFLISLDNMMDELSKDMTLSKFKEVSIGYKLYQEFLEKATQNKPVTNQEIIQFSTLHVSYVKFVNNWEKSKTEPVNNFNNIKNLFEICQN